MNQFFNDAIHNQAFIGANLKALRQSCDKTLEELANSGGISISYLSLVESGKRSIKPMILRSMLLDCGMTLGYFLSQIQLLLNEQEVIKHETVNSIVTKFSHSILLSGSRVPNEFSMVLHRIMETPGSHQLISCYLPAETAIHDTRLHTQTPIQVVVNEGIVLLEYKKAEYILKKYDECMVEANSTFMLRNYTQSASACTMVCYNGGF
jgi:transcriptional regulator with XRE-family HTH domain